MPKDCPAGQIRNPLTGRCIKSDGPTAKKLKAQNIIVPKGSPKTKTSQKKIYTFTCPLKFVKIEDNKSCKLTKVIFNRLKVSVKEIMANSRGGLAEYFEDDGLEMDWKKIVSMIVEVKGDEKKPQLVIVTTAKTALDSDEIEEVHDYIVSQLIDGWGAHIDQNLEFSHNCAFEIKHDQLKMIK